MDSNHRYRKVTDLQSAAIATMRHSPIYFLTKIINALQRNEWASRRTWTADLLITNQWLYQLSYGGKSKRAKNSFEERQIKNVAAQQLPRIFKRTANVENK